MSTIITCSPRTIPKKELISAAKAAVVINPLNAPNTDGLTTILGRRPNPDELAIATSKYWGSDGVRLTVGFLDNPSQELRDRIISHMNAWNKRANIEFTETTDITEAQVRINRERVNDPEWDGYWSFLGTDILKYQGPQGQNMNLEGFTMRTPDSEFYRVVRHEAGHALGFPHEHMRKELVSKINREKAIQYYKKWFNWDEEDVDNQVLTPLDDYLINGTPIAHGDSIMAYHIPGEITENGEPIPGGLDIVDTDHEFASLIYPK